MTTTIQNYLTYSQQNIIIKAIREAFMRNFLDQNQIITKIVLACFVARGTGNVVHTDRPSHGLALNLDGEKLYRFADGTNLVVKANDVVYLPKGSYYQVVSKTTGDCFAVNFQILSEETFPPFVLSVKNPQLFKELYAQATKIWQRNQSGREYKCKALLYETLYELSRQQESGYFPSDKQTLLAPAVAYIHRHYTHEAMNAQKLSELCGISYEYFRRLFKYLYGVSPVEYINRLKLTRAKELLSDGSYSVSEAAFESGFSDLSYFSRFFKRKTGISPSEYK